MKPKKILLLLPIVSTMLYGQDTLHLSSAPANGGVIFGCKGIVLEKGFSYSYSGSNGRPLLLRRDSSICDPNTGAAVSQSDGQNYILTVSPLDETDKVWMQCQIR